MRAAAAAAAAAGGGGERVVVWGELHCYYPITPHLSTLGSIQCFSDQDSAFSFKQLLQFFMLVHMGMWSPQSKSVRQTYTVSSGEKHYTWSDYEETIGTTWRPQQSNHRAQGNVDRRHHGSGALQYSSTPNCS